MDKMNVSTELTRCKRFSRMILPAAVLLLLPALLLGQDNNPEAAAIRRVMNDQVQAWNRGDIRAFMTGYWRSETLVFVSRDKVTRGWQQTLENYQRSYDTRAKMGTLSFSDLEITVLSKDAAVVLGGFALKRETDNPHGKFTLVFRKFREGWRIVMDHTS